MTSIHLNDIALPKKFEKLPLSYYINVKSESEFSKNFSKIFFFNVISQTYPKMVLRNAVLQKLCHHKNDSKPFPSLLGSLGLNLLKAHIPQHHRYLKSSLKYQPWIRQINCENGPPAKLRQASCTVSNYFLSFSV